MNILFIHQSFPGQFIYLAADLAKQAENKVIALSMEDFPAPKGVHQRRYKFLRSPLKEMHPLLQGHESHILRAEACASAALQLRAEGFYPDLIIAHPGWGEALFIKDVFPNAKIILYCEYYYSSIGQDLGFDPEISPVNFADNCRLRLKNSTNLLSMEIADAAISPTQWQKSTYPIWAQEKISVIHDGISLDRLRFNSEARLTVALEKQNTVITLAPGDEVVSYVARNLEPTRGFHVFMRTLPEVLARHPKARAIIVGGDQPGYGNLAPGGGTWRDYMLAELGHELDLNRVHFVGKIPYQSFLDLLSISAVHTYWTTPFVLSWSFLEAAASGVPLVASATQPVKEFADRLNIKTVDFFDKQQFADAICDQLTHAGKRNSDTPYLAEIDIKICLERQRSLISSVMA